jgi:hypothetical protein
MQVMKLFTYILRSDTGFAPNPFHGYCTLATCKPKIRQTAKAGDWVVGISPKKYRHKLVYAMKVTEICSFDGYFNDPRFAKKIPNCSNQHGTKQEQALRKCGDNIYEPLRNGRYRQLRSTHSGPKPFGREENRKKKEKDLKSKNVLISSADNFYYFGANAGEMPPEIKKALRAGRGHKVFDDRNAQKESIRDKTISFLKSTFQPGRHGNPQNWPDGQTCGGCS